MFNIGRQPLAASSMSSERHQSSNGVDSRRTSQVRPQEEMNHIRSEQTPRPPRMVEQGASVMARYESSRADDHGFPTQRSQTAPRGFARGAAGGFWGPRGRGNYQRGSRGGYSRAPRGGSRDAPQSEDDNLVKDLLRQIDEKNSELKALREGNKAEGTMVSDNTPLKTNNDQVPRHWAVIDDLKNMEQKLKEATSLNDELQAQKTEYLQTINDLQNQLNDVKKMSQPQCAGEETEVSRLQENPAAQMDEVASLERPTKNLQTILWDRIALCSDLEQRLTETRRDLREAQEQLEIEKDQKETLLGDVKVLEGQLYKMQSEQHHELVYLQRPMGNRRREGAEQGPTLNEEFRLKMELQQELERNEMLEKRLKSLNKEFEKTQCQLYRLQTQNSNVTTEKETTCVQKEHQDNEKLVQDLLNQLNEKNSENTALRKELEKNMSEKNKAASDNMEQKLEEATSLNDELRMTISDQMALCGDLERRLNETRQDLCKAQEQLEIEKAYKESLQRHADEMECGSHKTERQHQELVRLQRIVENLEREVTKQRQTITEQQKEELRLKTSLQEQMDSKETLKEGMNTLNRKFTVEHKEYVTKMEKCLEEANETIGKERRNVEKERQAKEQELSREVQQREKLQAKVSALEKALEEKKSEVVNLTARIETQTAKIKEAVTRSSTQILAVNKERNELRKMMAAQLEQANAMSQALNTAEDANRVLLQEKEALQTALRDSEAEKEMIKAELEQQQAEKKKRKSRWKFWKHG